MNGADHPIFRDTLLSGDRTLSTGQAPKPYHIYDGHGLVLLGYGDITALTGVFAKQDVHPVLTKDGKCILVLFICDFTESNHGPHNEFHVTVLAAPKPGQVISNDPAVALAALATQPDWGVLSLHLNNDTPQVVAYNTEYLGLDAQRSKGCILRDSKAVEFTFEDMRGGGLASGKVRLNARSDMRLLGRVMRHLGLRRVWQAIRKKPAEAYVINRKSAVIAINGHARTLTAPDKMIVTTFDPCIDHFEVGSGILASLGFEPRIIEHLWPFRFVYMHPDDA